LNWEIKEVPAFFSVYCFRPFKGVIFMKCTVSRIGCAAACMALCLALGCSCSVLPPASGKPAAAAPSVPTDKNGNLLYDSSRLDDGRLRMLYGYDSSGNSCTVLCGGKVLYQSFRSENVNLLQDTVTGETNYWFRTWADPDAYCGRRSGLFDKDGNEVMTFEGEQNASMQNGLLVLQEAHAVNGSYENGYDDYGTCQVIDLSTGERLPVPDGAYRCIVCGDRLVFTCYARPADLAEDAWDDEPALHSWVIAQTRDGTQIYRAETTTAMSISYAPDVLNDWVELDTCHASGEPTDETLYNPATGEFFTGFRQVCGSGTACFETSDGRYELRDLTTVDRTLIGTFDDQPSSYFPGYVVTWRTSGDFGYDLHDLVTGEVTPLYASSVMGDTIALYYEDGRLKVFSTATGDLITDTAVEPVEGQQSVMMDNKGDGYVWLELRDNDNFETTATRVYGPEGLVSDLTHLQDKYYSLNYLITTPEGRPLYCGNANAPSSNGSMCDVLDENGNIVFYGLGSCYSYYDNSLNQLPEHVFVAKRGFYYGWMDTDGKWLYCRSIFSSINADDEMGY